VVRYPIILFPVRSYFITTLTQSDLASTFSVPVLLGLLFGHLSQLCGENLESHASALVLGSHVDADRDPCRSMLGDDTGVGLIPSLTSRTTASSGRDLDIVLVQNKTTFLWGKSSYRDGTGLDPTTLLGGRDTLEPVAPSFVLKEPLGSDALEQDGNESGPMI